MKIKITEIEADAKELRESNTLGDNFVMLLKRCLQPMQSYDDEEEEEEDGGNNDKRAPEGATE